MPQADAQLPPLPQGFKLDAPAPQVQLPPLPQGFTLDQPGTPAAKPAAAAQGGSFLPEVGKGVAAGAANVVGSTLKGLSTTQARSPEEEKVAYELADELKRIPTMSEPEYNQFRLKAMKGIRGYKEMDLIALSATIRAGKMTPGEAAKRLDLPSILPQQTVQETPLYKAGQAVQDWSAEKFKAANDYENGWTRAISEGLGSTVPFVATAPLGGAGFVLGGAAGSYASAGEVIDAAIKNGATQQQIIDAAKLGKFPGLTDQIPIETLFERIPLPLAGKFAGVVSKVLAQAAVEGGQEGLQQAAQNLIAKYVYKPDQDITEGVAELAGIGAIIGGGLKGGELAGEKLLGGHEAEAQPQPQPAQPEASAAPPAPPPGFNVDQEPNAEVRAPGAAAAQPETEGEAVSPPANQPSPAPTPEAVPTPTPRPSPVEPAQRAMLRKMGWADADIDNMARQEVQAEAERGRAAKLTVSPEEEAAAGKPASAQTASQPTAEPSASPNASPAPTPAPETAAPTVTDGVKPAPEVSDAAIDADMDAAALASVRGLETEGQRGRPASIQTPEQLQAAGARVNVEPSEAQKAAGNYKKSHVRVAGLDVTIENPKGSTRRGSAGGQPWEAVLPAHYGYIKKTVGSDGDQVDVYVGDNPQSKKAYIVDQKAPSENGRFDEHKVILGAASLAQARELYMRAFSDGSGYKRLGAITSVSPKRLREWLNSDETGRAYAYGRTKLTESGFPADAKGKVKRPPSLTEFLARNGGIREDGGELGAMDAGKVFVPAAGKLVRPNGMTLDEARRLAVEHGYLSDAAADQQSTSTVDDLLVALRDDIASKAHFSSSRFRLGCVLSGGAGQQRGGRARRAHPR